MESAVTSNNARHTQSAIDVDATPGLTPTNEAVRDTSEFEISSSDPDNFDAAALLHPSPERREHASMDRNHGSFKPGMRKDHRSPGRRMDDEAIAGTAVGVILAFALLVCCLYPVVVYYIKKYRRSKRPLSWDYEYSTKRGYPPGTRPRRLSSSDKLDENGKDKNYSPQEGYAYSTPQAQNRQPTGYDGPMMINPVVEPAIQQRYEPYAAPFPYYQDAVPLPPAGPYPYVLKGTNEDYYSPYVPSEAFGMYPAPEPAFPPPSEPQRSAQRGTSFRQNVRSLLRRKTDREPVDNSFSATPYSDYPIQEGPSQFQMAPQGPGPMVMPQYYPTGQLVGNPGQPYPNPYCPVPGTLVDMSAMPTYADSSASQASSGQGLPLSVLGTVNPMDIMQPSTESEMWHSVDFHLYSSGQDSSPGSSSSLEMIQPENTLPPSQLPLPMGNLLPIGEDSIPDLERQANVAFEEPLSNPVPPTQNFATSISAPPSVSSSAPDTVPAVRPSQPARTTSTKVPSSANTSSRGSPSTHGDSPSPGSLNSSEPRQSNSPPGVAHVSSPKGGVYRCDEPGCNQSFDQPHKLKHHQRYHSKDHKCPYPTCGKGFGTKTHLQRHINDRHEKKKKFHCSISGCDYSRTGGKAFPRKDNWKRHMTKIHGMDHGSLPEPVEVDQEMAGA